MRPGFRPWSQSSCPCAIDEEQRRSTVDTRTPPGLPAAPHPLLVEVVGEGIPTHPPRVQDTWEPRTLRRIPAHLARLPGPPTRQRAGGLRPTRVPLRGPTHLNHRSMPRFVTPPHTVAHSMLSFAWILTVTLVLPTLGDRPPQWPMAARAEQTTARLLKQLRHALQPPPAHRHSRPNRLYDPRGLYRRCHHSLLRRLRIGPL